MLAIISAYDLKYIELEEALDLLYKMFETNGIDTCITVIIQIL